MRPINLAEKFAQVDDFWHPRIVAELNGQAVKVVKLKGEFVWHHHEVEDELFFVLHGHLRMRFRDREEVIGPGELIVVPAGVEHQPVAAEETHVLLFEPQGTLNTGNVQDERTVPDPERL